MNSNPRNVVWMSKNEDQIETLCYDLDGLYQDITQQLSRSPRRYLTHIPKSFIVMYKEYHDTYSSVVSTAAAPKQEKWRKFLCEHAEELIKSLQERGVDTDAPEDFSISKDDPVDLFFELLMKADDWSQAHYGEDYGDDVHKELGAWQFFEETIGIDLRNIHRRWGEIPPILIPKHVSDRHGLTEPGSLYEQLDEAHRAYVFGCYAASITLCRALMELLLQEHYEVRGRDLEQIISFAEEKYLWLRNLHLQTKRAFANAVLHDRRRAENLEAEQVRSFLETIKTLIERAPPK